MRAIRFRAYHSRGRRPACSTLVYMHHFGRPLDTAGMARDMGLKLLDDQVFVPIHPAMVFSLHKRGYALVSTEWGEDWARAVLVAWLPVIAVYFN